MTKFAPFLLSGLLLLGGVACSDVAKTSADAPNSTKRVGEVPKADSTKNTAQDAQRDLRSEQIKSDERARAQRNQAGGDETKIADNDVESLVRNQLEQELPSSQLAVDSEEGIVTISGTVPSQTELNRIATVAQKVKGVKEVKVNAKVAKPQPDKNP